MSTSGQRLKALREEQKLTQKELARLIGVNRATLANWETNRTQPDYDGLCRIASYFKVSSDYLIGRTNERSAPEGIESIDEAVALALRLSGVDNPPAEAIGEVKNALEYAKWKHTRREKD
jgi:transcriptional regulator with XRE-family HTH domain